MIARLSVLVDRMWGLAAATVLLVALGAAPVHADAAFAQWLEQLWPEAQARGISRATFDLATRGLEPELTLPDLVIPGRPHGQPGQAEFIKSPADYLLESTLARLTEQGRKLAATHAATLAKIEQAFGVPGPMLLAIFGRETAYGTYQLPHNAIRVLATQAYLGSRKDKFRTELLFALKMIEDGHVKLADMRSSWAGAMGYTQFMPSDFYRYAVDFDHDGKYDLWHSLPDALASAARQLIDKGWQRGKPWGFEVRTPNNLDCTFSGPTNVKPLGEWLKAGFAPAFGKQVPPDLTSDEVSLFLPAGTYGPAFIAFKNFYALKEYNFSDLYVLFVGHLADRIGGGRQFERPWQRLIQLHARDLEEMQRRLTGLGLYSGALDGKAGAATRLSLGEYQKRNGLKVDCWPTSAVLDHMRARTN